MNKFKVLLISERLVIDPGGDHIGHGFAGPLGSHMANTLDSDEVEAIVALNVAAHLPVRQPGSPCINDAPLEVLNPSLASVSSYSAISIT